MSFFADFTYEGSRRLAGWLFAEGWLRLAGAAADVAARSGEAWGSETQAGGEEVAGYRFQVGPDVT